MNTDRYYDVEDSDWIHIDDHNKEIDYLEYRLQELEHIEDFYLSEERCVLEQLFDVIEMLKANRPNQFVIQKLDSIINSHSKDLVNKIKIQRLNNA
jgi:hypothetical protein